MLEPRVERPVDGRALRVARAGSGPPVVFLHGYPDTLRIWDRVRERLSDAFETIAFDWPGLGGSEAWNGGATPYDQAERLRRMLDAWGLERASLVGADMGAQPALVFAARHPGRIHRLAVLNCLAFPDERTSWEIRVLRRFGWNRLLLRRFPGLVFRRAERTFLPDGGRLPEEVRADLWAHFRRPDVRDFLVRMCAGYEGSLPRLPALYRGIACPTLVLWGDRDPHFPPAHAVRLHEAVAGSRLERLPEGGHWMMWNRADEVTRRLRGFLASPDAAGGP